MRELGAVVHEKGESARLCAAARANSTQARCYRGPPRAYQRFRSGTWVAVLAVIGIVLSGVHLSSLTDPAGRDTDYPSGKEAVSPGVPP